MINEIEVTFSELPPKCNEGRSASREWASVADQLRAHPDEWADLGTHSRSFPAHRPFALCSPDFEMTTRDNDVSTGRATIWARYIGETE